MSQFRFRNTKKSKKLNKSPLQYQRFEDRNLLAADLQFGPDALTVLRHEVSELARLPDEVVEQQLALNEGTDQLQSGLSNLIEVATRAEDGNLTTLFQQTWNGLPVYGSWLTTIQNGSGDISNVRDQTLAGIEAYAEDVDPISEQQAIEIANRGISKPVLMDSTVSQGWYTAGDRARLAWVVDTTVSDPDGDVVNEYETWVNVFDGQIFTRDSQGQVEEVLLNDPISDVGVFPRIVINDDIGPAGSQAFAAPFDAVVSISVGCTGALIAPNAVISARHCGISTNSTVSFGDDSGNPTGTFGVASVLNPAGPGTLLDGGDVTILTLDSNVPESIATPLRFLEAGDELVGMTALTLGYGFNGVGSTGHEFSADGLRWGGENIIDAVGTPSGAFGANIISTDFDDGTATGNTIAGSDPTPLEFEATTAPGDSGGAILVNKNGEWLITGVLSGGTTATSVYGDISWWTGTSIYRDEIEAVGGEFAEDESSIGFDQDEYFLGDTINIRVLDPNNNGADISITVTSELGDTEVLTASPSADGDYNFTLESANANIVFNDGTLQANANDTIVVTYNDPVNAEGVPEAITDTAIMRSVSASQLIGVDFDTETGGAPFGWHTVSGGSDTTISDLSNELSGATPVDLTINGSWTALDVSIDAGTLPQYPNTTTRFDGQIQTSAQPIELIWSDLVPFTDYLVYVMSAEGVFDSIEQSVSIKGDGSPVTFEQRFNNGELFVNDQVGDSTRDLFEYAQLITADIDGKITIDITPIGGTADVVLAGVALTPYDNGIDAISDSAVTDEDESVIIAATANDIERDGQDITLTSVGTPANGTAVITANGTINYTPGTNFVGTDNFTYVISDPDGNTATGYVSVEVSGINDAPTGILLSPNVIAEDTSTVFDAFVGNLTGFDVDNATHEFRLADGQGDGDNSLFRIDGDSLFIKAGTDIDFDSQPQYSIRVEASDGELTVERSLAIVVLDVDDAVSVSLDDGDGQRSMVTETVLTFNEVVTINPGAFVVTKRGPGGGNVGVTPIVDDSSGVTVVTLSFFGQHVTGAGSLEDGNYQLTVDGDLIITAGGATLDADGDGEAGGNFVFGDTATDNFFRLYGDVDGDRVVSTIDLLGFRRTFLDRVGDEGFDDRFDFDADGVISTIDLLRFRKNFLERLDFA